MTERPIPFTAPMVQANRAGRKTETRRMAWKENMTFTTAEAPREKPREEAAKNGVEISQQEGGRWRWRIPTPYQRYKPGDLLWVREGWRVSSKWDATKPRDLPARTMTVFYEAGGSMANQPSGEWEADKWPAFDAVRPDWVGRSRPAMFMPRWASRDTLEVLAVRVEPLQAITEAGCIAEGCEAETVYGGLGGKMVAVGPGRYLSPKAWYHELFDHINGPGSWDRNPDVVVISYKRLTK